jgi:putative ABC transport system permease protein
MRARDVFSFSFSAIKLRKLRAGLTILGVVVGITAIVALLSITQGMQDSISEGLERGFAADTLVVMANTGGGASSSFRLYINYTDTISSLSPNIIRSFATVLQPGYIKAGDVIRLVPGIAGLDFSEFAEIYSKTFVADSGTLPLNPTEDEIVVGARVSDPQLNGTKFVEAGDDVTLIWVNATTFPVTNSSYAAHVAAVLSVIGDFGIAGPSDYGVYIPLSKAESFFGTDEAHAIIVRLKNSDNATITEVSEAITDYFGDQVVVISSAAVIDLVSETVSTTAMFLGGVAAISLLVAGIGIMNIMIVSLIERTREIGILKALGMKSRTVLAIFLSEAVLVGLLGAVFGIGLGWLVANVASRVFIGGGQAVASGGFVIIPVLTPTVLLGALGFGVIVSVIFALYPAWRASKLKPVDALRYE